jgi:hypothetical protein
MEWSLTPYNEISHPMEKNEIQLARKEVSRIEMTTPLFN